MQLSRNRLYKPVTNLSDFFLLFLTYNYMVFKMAMYLVLEKNVFVFLVGKYFEVV